MKLIRPQTDQVISVRTAPGNLTPNISENWKVYATSVSITGSFESPSVKNWIKRRNKILLDVQCAFVVPYWTIFFQNLCYSELSEK